MSHVLSLCESRNRYKHLAICTSLVPPVLSRCIHKSSGVGDKTLDSRNEWRRRPKEIFCCYSLYYWNLWLHMLSFAFEKSYKREFCCWLDEWDLHWRCVWRNKYVFEEISSCYVAVCDCDSSRAGPGIIIMWYVGLVGFESLRRAPNHHGLLLRRAPNQRFKHHRTRSRSHNSKAAAAQIALGSVRSEAGSFDCLFLKVATSFSCTSQ